MTSSRYSAVLPYLSAVALVAAAVAFRFAVDPVLQGRQPFAAFFVAVILAGRFCGFAPSLLTLFLSALASRYFFISPRGSFAINGWVEQWSFWFFVVISLFLAFLMRAEQRAKEESRRKAADAVQKQDELERENAERTRIETELRASEARLLLALEAGRMGYWSWDLSTNRVQSSETQAVIHGRSPDQTDTRIEDSHRNIHPDDRQSVQEVIERALRNEAPERITYRVIWPDGDIHWIEAVGRVFCDASGTPNRVMGVCVDITERKKSEIALKESEDRFRAFMNHVPATAWAKDEQGRFVYVNKAYEEVARLRSDELLGKTDFDIWPEEIARRFWDGDRKVLANAEPLRITEESMFPGHEGHYWFKTKFMFHDGRNGRLVGGIGLDVTESMRTEQALRTKQELLRNLIEVQEKEKQFLCHEFHDGLMQYAVGSLLSLESYREKYPNLEGEATIATVIGNLQKGVEDGRRTIRGIRPAVLDDLGLDAAMDDLIEQYSTSGIMVTSHCDPEIGRLPNTIQTTVYRVVQEALNNAKKYSGTDVVRIELKKVDGDLRLEVRDFGCGFEVESARKKGFGLLGMTERVRLLGGECEIQSEQDAGTRISVRLPLP